MALRGKVSQPQPQVFISFRGVELRDNFVNRLVKALREGEINVFIDVHESKGTELRHLLTRIKMSKIALVVFSKYYCESKWCLDELVEIDEHMREGKLVVIPIFYNVTASDVKRAANLSRETDSNGRDEEFTALFKQMKRKYAYDPLLIKKWEHALNSVSKRMGFATEVYGDSLVKSVVMEVRRHQGMPPKKTMSHVRVAFRALWGSLVFSYIIAPLLFPDVKLFKTGKWVLGFPFLVIASRIWYRKYYNTPLAYISHSGNLYIKESPTKASFDRWIRKTY